MSPENFIITEFINCFYAKDPTGRKKEFIDRRYGCFIITLKGRIRFTSNGTKIYSDKDHAVFLPRGLSYTNECLENAESIVFNIETKEDYTSAVSLSTVPESIAKNVYTAIKKEASSLSVKSKLFIMRELYTLIYGLFPTEEKSSATDKIITSATEYMMENYHNPELDAASIATHCYISEIYLRKLFSKKLNSTPHKILTDIRMKKAYMLAKEKRPVKEIAEEVGFAAVYQFSRAYKKYYGFSPSET